ncbi:MAG: hypothetical protein KBB39_16575 [Phycicoccus sp.]|nr:hypothetical protein [Phycicoccus sp.]
MPEPLDDHEVDERFADIVEQWRTRDEPSGEVEPAPTEADVSPPTAAEPPDLVISVDPAWRRPADRPTWDEILDAEEAQGFTPPPVELPPGEDLHYWGAVIGLVAGPLLVLWVAFGGPASSGWWLLAGIGLTVAGFALLVLRMPTHRDPGDDDGARV